MTDLRLTVGSDGRLRGNANISYNRPFPCVNGTPHITRAMRGVLMHTMVGYLAGTIAVFNRPGFGASAHFGIAQDGRIHQFGPIGTGWEAWHAYAANREFYGIEFEDAGNPDNPISDKAVTAAAQVVECLSAFAGFPLRVQDTCDGRGFAYHSLCPEWNLSHHTCPDLPPRHVRSQQRTAIIALAGEIRAYRPPPVIKLIIADGIVSLHDVAISYRNRPFMILVRTFRKTGLQVPLLRYLATRRWATPLPRGVVLAVEVPAAP